MHSMDTGPAQAPSPKRHAVILLSGGMDSALTLAEARAQGFECHALSVDYGQRHRVELKAAAELATLLGAASHKVVQMDLRALGGSALTADIDVPTRSSEGIPVTYVPARNSVLLALAMGWAEVVGATDLFAGVNAVDYSGYPDCRPAFVAAFQALAHVATRSGVEGRPWRVHAPLLNMSKAMIVKRGIELGVDFGRTISCYQANAEGQACGACDACRLRAKGFADAGMADPTRYVS